MAALHNTVIWHDTEDLPTRKDLLIASEYAEISADIAANKPLIFMPTGIHETNMVVGNARYAYVICAFGVLQDGRHATVVVHGIQPELYVEVPAGTPDPQSWAAGICDVLATQRGTGKYASRSSIELASHEIVMKRPLRYIESPSINQSGSRSSAPFDFEKVFKPRIPFVKLTFWTSTHRKNAIRYLLGKKYTLAVDDSIYYRVFARNNKITLGTWVTLSKYAVKNEDVRESKAKIKGPFLYVHYEHFKPSAVAIKDKTLTCYWDIETYSPSGAVPQPENPDHRIIMISVVFFQCHESKPFLQVCIVDKPSLPHPEFLTIVCGDGSPSDAPAIVEERMIRMFAQLIECFRPEVLGGFNTTDYDWPWIVIRAAATPDLLGEIANRMDPFDNNYEDSDVLDCEDFVQKRSEINSFSATNRSDAWNSGFKIFKTDTIKLEADASATGHYINLPGHLDLDVRTIFRKITTTTEKTGLKDFLEANGLKGKKEMPIPEIFACYREILALEAAKAPITQELQEKYREIAAYCVYDSIRCHELMFKRKCITEMRKFAELVFLTVDDAYRRANGLRVRNILYAYAWDEDIIHTSLSNPNDDVKVKFTGAYVLAPKEPGLFAPKLSLDERIAKYLSSLTPEGVVAFFKDCIKKRTGDCPDVPLSELRAKYSHLVTKIFDNTLASVEAHTHVAEFGIHAEDYRKYAELSESELVRGKQYLARNH